MTAPAARPRDRFDDTVANTPFDTAVEAQMAALLAFLPLAFGGTLWWGREVWFVLAAGMGLCVLAKLLAYRGARAVGSWAYVPIAAFVALVVLQAVPLPAAVVAALSPGAAATRAEFLADLPAARSGPQTLSLYAHATWQQLTWVLAAATVFAVVLHAYRAPARVRRLLVTITLAGLAVASVAAYQDLTDATLIYGTVPIGHANAGPFQNYSHFSQFMNLSVGAALALILWTLTEWTAGVRDAAAEVVRRVQRIDAWPVWAAGVLCVGGPVLVLWSKSRMGMVSLLVAGGVTAALLGLRADGGGSRPKIGRSGRRRRSGSTGSTGRSGGHAFLIAGLGLAVFAVVLAVGFDAVYDRLATLRDAEHASGGRWQMLKDLVPVYRKFPVFGTGLGTHEFVFPGYDHRDLPSLATHAENEYAQLMEETGGVGVAAAAAFLGVVGAAFLRATHRPATPAQFAAFGLGFGLLAVLVHSGSDFGQHVPSDATLTAVCGALLVNVAASVHTRPAENLVRRRRAAATGTSVALRAAALAAFAVVAGWTTLQADRERRAESDYRDAKTLAAGIATLKDVNDDDYRGLLTAATNASTLEPADVTYAYWLNAYRWQAISRDVDPQTHATKLSGAAVAFAGQLVTAFDAIRVLCPTYGPPLGVAGQIRSAVLHDAGGTVGGTAGGTAGGDGGGDAEIRTARRLAPYDATLCRIAGEAAARQGEYDTAINDFKRYVLLGGDKRSVVDAFAMTDRPHLAYQFAEGDRGAIDELAARTTDPRWAAFCRAQSAHLVRIAATQPGADGELLMARGRLDIERGHAADAAGWYEKALVGDYGRTDWHMELAKADAAAGRYGEAVRQLQVCLRLRPHWDEAEHLIATYAGRDDAPAGINSAPPQ